MLILSETICGHYRQDTKQRYVFYRTRQSYTNIFASKLFGTVECILITPLEHLELRFSDPFGYRNIYIVYTLFSECYRIDAAFC